MQVEKIVIEEGPGHQNVTAHLKENCPCSGITLERKALRVIFGKSPGRGEAPFQVLSPRQGRQNLVLLKIYTTIPKICSKTELRFAKIDMLNEFAQTRQLHQRIRLNLK